MQEDYWKLAPESKLVCCMSSGRKLVGRESSSCSFISTKSRDQSPVRGAGDPGAQQHWQGLQTSVSHWEEHDPGPALPPLSGIWCDSREYASAVLPAPLSGLVLPAVFAQLPHVEGLGIKVCSHKCVRWKTCCKCQHSEKILENILEKSWKF